MKKTMHTEEQIAFALKNAAKCASSGATPQAAR